MCRPQFCRTFLCFQTTWKLHPETIYGFWLHAVIKAWIKNLSKHTISLKKPPELNHSRQSALAPSRCDRFLHKTSKMLVEAQRVTRFNQIRHTKQPYLTARLRDRNLKINVTQSSYVVWVQLWTHKQKKILQAWSFAYFAWGLACLQNNVSFKVLAEAWQRNYSVINLKKSFFFLIPERILKIDGSHSTAEIPLLKCLPSALTLLFPSCPAGFQPFVSNWCFVYLDYRSALLRKSAIMHSGPVKSEIQCVSVCVCTVSHSAFSKKKGKETEKRLQHANPSYCLYLPPLISSIATRILAVMRRTRRLTALSCLNGCSWHILHVCTHTHTHKRQRVIREKSRRCEC